MPEWIIIVHCLQLQLVSLNDENNTQVYIQIDNNQQLGLVQEQITNGQQEEIPTAIEIETPTEHRDRVIHPSNMKIKQVNNFALCIRLVNELWCRFAKLESGLVLIKSVCKI